MTIFLWKISSWKKIVTNPLQNWIRIYAKYFRKKGVLNLFYYYYTFYIIIFHISLFEFFIKRYVYLKLSHSSYRLKLQLYNYFSPLWWRNFKWDISALKKSWCKKYLYKSSKDFFVQHQYKWVSRHDWVKNRRRAVRVSLVLDLVAAETI